MLTVAVAVVAVVDVVVVCGDDGGGETASESCTGISQDKVSQWVTQDDLLSVAQYYDVSYSSDPSRVNIKKFGRGLIL